jgi:diguanylate cyclase (GGDEF)-like protein
MMTTGGQASGRSPRDGDVRGACLDVAERLAAAGGAGTAVAVLLEHGGRLRCAAVAGAAQVRDNLPCDAGAPGRALATARDAAGRPGEGSVLPPGAPETALPVVTGGRVASVVVVGGAAPAGAALLAEARACAAALGSRLAAAPAPAETPARRLLRDLARLSALEAPAEIGAAVLDAALVVTPLDSALLAVRGRDGALRPRWATGPLAGVLRDVPLAMLEDAVRDGASWRTAGSDGAPALAALRERGARTVIAAGLSAGEGEPDGILLGGARRAVRLTTGEAELLELLAAHAAGALRAAGRLATLRRRAESDPLTGLGHHATFHAALAGAHRRPRTAVVLCDLDGFKALNDTRGHLHGDDVLRGVAAALEGALRRGDRLFRIGGDEFAALVAVESAEEAREAGQRLRAAVEDAGLGVSVSVGVAVPGEGEPDHAVLARADRALYRVKATGRDGVAVAEDAAAASPAT